MDREEQIADILRANEQLMTIALGGVYTDKQLGIQGFTREEGSVTENAFDENGYLKTSIVVHSRGPVPTFTLSNHNQKLNSTREVVEVYLYENRGTEDLVVLKDLTYTLLQGARIEDAYPLSWDLETSVYYDVGPVENSTVIRQDWEVISIRKPVVLA